MGQYVMIWVAPILEHFETYSGAYSTFAMIVVALATIYYARQAHLQAREAQHTRELISRPYIWAQVGLGQNRWAVMIVLHNAGNTIAKNIRFSLRQDLKNKDGQSVPCEMTIPALVPQQKHEYFIGFSDHYLGPSCPDSLSCEIEYTDAENCHMFKERYLMPFRVVLEQSVPGGKRPILEEIKDELRGIRSVLQSRSED